MNHRLLISLTVALLTLGGISSVHAEEDPTTQSVFSESEREEVRAMLEQVLTAHSETSSNTAETTNMATVADRALDLTTDFVTTVASKMEEVAPHVWRIMIRQQYAEAIGKVIVPWGLFFFVFIFASIARKFWKLDEVNQTKPIWYGGELSDRGVRGLITFLIPFILMFITMFFGVFALQDSIKLLINPEYYAIRDLMMMLFGNTPGM